MVSTVNGGESVDAESPRGDPSDLEIETLSRGLEIVAVRRLSDAEEAREAVQETLARTWEAIRQGRVPADTPVSAFAYGVHSHVIADLLRDRYRGGASGPRPDLLPAPDPSPLERLVSVEEQRRVAKAVARLSAGDRRLLRSCFVEGRKLVEIAREKGVPSARIRKRKSRALERLRRILGSGRGVPAGHDPDLSPTSGT